jgi:outer membrane autotransporter protein
MDGTSGKWSTSCLRTVGGQQPGMSGVSCYRAGTPVKPEHTIKIIKETTKPVEADTVFGFTASGSGVSDFELEVKDGKTSAHTQFASLGAGTYTFTEAQLAGWQLTGLKCDVTTGTPPNGFSVIQTSLANKNATITLPDTGENLTVTCTFTNKREIVRKGSITITKVVTGGTSSEAFDFTGNLGGFSLKGGESETFPGLAVNASYTVTETPKAGFKLTDISCTGSTGTSFAVDLASGSVKVSLPDKKDPSASCTFTNFKETDDEMEDVTKVFINRRVDNLLSHNPDRAHLLRRLQEDEQPVSLKDSDPLPPLKFSGQMDERGIVGMQFSSSLSQMRSAAIAADAANLREARRSEDGPGMSYMASDPYLAPYLVTRPGWDLWIEGQVSRYDDSTGGINREGLFSILYVGVDYAVGPGMIVGALVQVDHTDEDVKNPNLYGTVEGTGWMVGPYFGARISDNLIFDARAAWGRSSNDIELFSPDVGWRKGSFDTDRWLATAKLTGLWHHDGWRFSPHVGVAWGTEHQDAYSNSIDQSIGANRATIGRVTFGPEIGYRIMLEDGTVVEPHVSLEGIWNFHTEDLVVGGTVVSPDEFRAKLEAGVIFASPDGYRLRAAGSYDGLGDSDFEAWSAKAWLNIPLN